MRRLKRQRFPEFWPPRARHRSGRLRQSLLDHGDACQGQWVPVGFLRGPSPFFVAFKGEPNNTEDICPFFWGVPHKPDCPQAAPAPETAMRSSARAFFFSKGTWVRSPSANGDVVLIVLIWPWVKNRYPQ